jgi:hypothetical protein
VTKRRTGGRVRKGFPTGGSRPGPAPAADKNRPMASHKKGRAAAERQAVRRKLRAVVIGDGRLLDVERGALVPVSALKIKIAQPFGITS